MYFHIKKNFAELSELLPKTQKLIGEFGIVAEFTFAENTSYFIAEFTWSLLRLG
jgi:hypothetical protein